MNRLFPSCLFVVFCAVVSAQTTADQLERTFHLTQGQSAQELQEIGTLLRSIGDIREASVNPELRTITLRGTSDQLELTQWLVSELDRPAGQITTSTSGVLQYTLPGGTENLVRILRVSNAGTIQTFQEIATVIRSISDIRRLFTSNALQIIVLRGTPEQIGLAEWLENELDQPITADSQAKRTQTASARDYRFGQASDDVSRVFYVTNSETIQQFQQIVRRVREQTGIRRVFTYNALRAVAARGTAEQIATADRMFQELSGR